VLLREEGVIESGDLDEEADEELSEGRIVDASSEHSRLPIEEAARDMRSQLVACPRIGQRCVKAAGQEDEEEDDGREFGAGDPMER
jgi:hypothetical protein